MVFGMAVHTPACVDRVRTAGTCCSLSQLGPTGMMSFKGKRAGQVG